MDLQPRSAGHWTLTLRAAALEDGSENREPSVDQLNKPAKSEIPWSITLDGRDDVAPVADSGGVVRAALRSVYVWGGGGR